ncbi:MAG: hypothetical protein IKW83_01625 [Muribaculaceae bacterium]|nr:hypothetical protein [Muribaculaceae bacterium]
MIKKLFLAIFLALPLLASAQLGAGQWKIHPYFVGSSAKNCIDAGDRVYYLSSGSLYCYDKEQQSNMALNANNLLNGIIIKQIYYNYTRQYLVVAYSDCNIDIIQANGEVINIPAIKDVVMHKAKTINDVNFCNGRVYIATSFGYLMLDDETFDIKEVRNYDANVASVAEIGGYKVMSTGSKFYYCDADTTIEAARWHKQVANAKGDGRILPINDTKFFLTCKSTFQIVTIGHGTDSLGVDTLNFTLKQVVAAAPTTVQPTPTGFVASFPAKNYYYTILPDASKTTKVTGNKLMSSQENGNWWTLGADGLTHVVDGEAGENVLPNGVSISANAYYSTYDPYQQRVLLGRTTDNFVLEGANSGAKTEINAYDGALWSNITPAGAPNNQGNKDLVISPNEPNTYYYCCRLDSGVCKVQNDSVVISYTAANSPYVSRCVAMRFDSQGNLWMPQSRSTNNVDAFAITPENQLLTVVDPSKFVINDMGGACFSSGFKRFSFDIGAGDTKVYSAGDYESPVIIWNNNEDLSLKQYKVFKSFNDQDNKSFAPWGWVYIKADNDGMIWFATVNGVVSLNPLEAFDEDVRINRITYTKNEGAEVSGVLCEGLEVNYIDVDAANNKWLATDASGVYFVSPDGSEIFKHFNTSNSPLPSDKVYSVCCNRATNSVIMVTPNGVVEYFPDVTPAEDDYSNVYAYPELVEPDFTGMITIKGLMANSNVVITDGDGNVVKTMVSIGGIALWDVCDENGEKVDTGIYKVYASQGDTVTTGEPLTEIAVIK